MFNLFFILKNSKNMMKISKTLFNISNNLGVDFKEPEYPQTAPDEIAMNQFMLDNDLTTKAKILRKYNKDLTLEQAEQEVKENKESNEQGKEQQPQGLFGRIGQRPAATE